MITFRPLRRTRCGFGIFLILLISASTAAASDMGLAGAARVSEASYRHFLDDMLYTHFGDDRGFGAEHDMARDNIADHFTSLGLTVALEPVYYSSGTYYNVVATKTGTDFPDQYYLVGAHYDSVSNPGADDNASGVALVMETARVLAPLDSAYSIVFVAFDREEQGLYGSYEYVDAHINDDILGMISADMVAYNHNGANRADIFGQGPSLPIKQGVAAAVTMYSGGLTPSIGGSLGASDHAPFEYEGFQACLLIEDWGNPNYHTQADSVDTPNYIDYAFATGMTRSVVGFLVDHAQVDVPLPDGDFNLDTFVDLSDYALFEQCYTGADNGPLASPCDLGDFDFDNDVDCDDWLVFIDLWTDPVDPPKLPQCIIIDPLPASWPHSPTKNRYVSFEPNNGDVLVAYEIEIAQSAMYPSAQGIYGWVSAPDEFGISSFVDNPEFIVDWPEPVLVGDCEIMPATTYHVRGTIDAELFSEPLAIATTPKPLPKAWADICGPYNGSEWGAPNGTINFDDVYAAIMAFQEMSAAPHFSWADVEPETPNGIANINDVFQLILAFQGNEYPYTDPDRCP